MSRENEVLVREAYEAYEAYGRGDVDRMLTFVDPELEWTYLDPSQENPEPQTCRGRDELARALRRQARQGLTAQIEEITACGDQVLVVTRTPGVDQVRARTAGDRNYLVLTLHDSRIIAMRACRDDSEARRVAGLA
jgi:ketosteroid isomerase-like protein